METTNDDTCTPAAAPDIDAEGINATVAAFTRSLPWPHAGTAWAREHRSVAAEHRRVATEHEDAAGLIDAIPGASTLDDVAHLAANGGGRDITTFTASITAELFVYVKGEDGELPTAEAVREALLDGMEIRMPYGFDSDVGDVFDIEVSAPEDDDDGTPVER